MLEIRRYHQNASSDAVRKRELPYLTLLVGLGGLGLTLLLLGLALLEEGLTKGMSVGGRITKSE